MCNLIYFCAHGLLKKHVICGKIIVPCNRPRKKVAHKKAGFDIIEMRIMKYGQKNCKS